MRLSNQRAVWVNGTIVVLFFTRLCPNREEKYPPRRCGLSLSDKLEFKARSHQWLSAGALASAMVYS